jgi:hypothetical protein
MAYQKPFTPKQRREAVEACRSYRRHYSHLRRHFPPVTTDQHQILGDYADAIEEIKHQLRKVDRAIDIAALNRSDAWARWLAVEYWQNCNRKD